MAELLVPGPVHDPFREHYRELIVSSMLRAAREQSTLYREQNQPRRAARYDRAVALLGGESPNAVMAPPPVVEAPPPDAEAPPPVVAAPPPVVEGPLPPVPAPAPVEPVHELAPPFVPVLVSEEVSFGLLLRGAAVAVWFLTLATLLVNILVFGFRSWATGAADLGLIALTLVWFAIAAGDVGPAGIRS